MLMIYNEYHIWRNKATDARNDDGTVLREPKRFAPNPKEQKNGMSKESKIEAGPTARQQG